MKVARFAAATSAAFLLAAAAPMPAQDPVAVPVTVTKELGDHQSGRLIVFAKKVEPGAKPETEIDTNPFAPTAVSLAAREVPDLSAGNVVLVDGSESFPAPLSAMPPGTYRLQAVLDRNHDYNYANRGPGDLVSDVIEVTLPGAIPVLTLKTALPQIDPLARLSRMPEEARARLTTALGEVKPVDFVSPSLSAFWGRPVHMQGWVALPPGYDPAATKTYPVSYSTHGFGGNLAGERFSAAKMTMLMAEGAAPPMIWVFLDQSSATGTHEFADSVNNGPWGHALTAELIPALDKQYRTDARAGGRFLTGHSSGGWAALWLQIAYPKLFGGSWPTSPDPGDFHDFTNVDLYAANPNLYAGADGKDFPLIRDQGKTVASLREFARIESVLGGYGGQFASFEWVFSPRGADGRPQPLFDRATGKVDTAVVAYWRDHYDVAHIAARDWAKLKPDLTGKLHLTVGTADTFYLDGPARRLQAVLEKLGAKPDFRYIPGKTHFDLFTRGEDRDALLKDIAWEMYAVARPGAKRP